MFDPTDKKFISIRDLRSLLSTKKMFRFDFPTDSNLGKLNTDHQFQGIEWFVSRLDSNCNYYKVESHTILTKMLFMMCTHGCGFSFDEHKIVCVIFNEKEVVYLRWKFPEDLMKITWVMLDSIDDNCAYDNYRHATREITDNLSEDHQPRDTWTRILKLTGEYFRNIEHV